MDFRRTAIILSLLSGLGFAAYLAFGSYCRSRSRETVRRAVMSMQQGHPEQARSILKWLLWFEPNNSAANHVVGLSHLKEGNVPEAVSHLERAVRTSRNSRQAESTLATALMQNHEWDRAISTLGRHLKRYPDSVAACRQLSGMLQTELRQRESVQVLKDCLENDTSERITVEDRINLVLDLLIAEFSPPPASVSLATLEDVHTSRPGQADVQLALGHCYWKAGKADRAKSLLQTAFEQRPQEILPRLLYSEFLIEQGDAETAEQVLLKASPDSQTSAMNSLQQDDRFWMLQCRIQEMQKQYSLALSHIDRALEILPADRDYLSRRARLLRLMRRATEAAEANTTSHELSKAELELWHLSRTLDAESVTPEQCRQVRELYIRLGRSLQAAVWGNLAEQMSARQLPESAL